jgi:GNAT superfamily N-acetyltransferase
MLSAAFTIRPATLADVATIVTHRHRMFEDMGHTNLERLYASLPDFEGWLRARLVNERYLGWLAETSEGIVVAGAGLWLLDWPPGALDLSPYRGYILNVYTEPDYRRRGLARQLVQCCVDWCGAQDIRVVSLHASVEGRRVYELMGFEPTNEMRLILPSR